MSALAGLLVILVAALAQASVLPAFSIFGAQPNLLVVLLVVWIIVGAERDALLLIPTAGFIIGLLDAEPLGLAMLALAPLILMLEVRELRLAQSELLLAMVLVALATLAYEGTFLISLALRGQQLDWPASALDVLVPAIIANVLLLLPVYGLGRLLGARQQRRLAY